MVHLFPGCGVPFVSFSVWFSYWCCFSPESSINHQSDMHIFRALSRALLRSVRHPQYTTHPPMPTASLASFVPPLLSFNHNTECAGPPLLVARSLPPFPRRHSITQGAERRRRPAASSASLPPSPETNQPLVSVSLFSPSECTTNQAPPKTRGPTRARGISLDHIISCLAYVKYECK